MSSLLFFTLEWRGGGGDIRDECTYFVIVTTSEPVLWRSNQAQSLYKMALKSCERRRETCRSDVSFQQNT